ERADAVRSFALRDAVSGGAGAAAAAGATVVVAAVVLGFDVGLGQTIKEEQPAPPALRDAALKLALEGDDRKGHMGVVDGLSGLPPADAVDLVSDDGRKTATVAVVPQTKCADASDKRNAGYTGPGETAWCLQFAHAPDHGVMTGVATGRQAEDSNVPA